MQIEREQEQKIDQFFDEYYRIKKWDKQSSEVVAGVFVCIQIVLMAFPIQLLYTEENRLPCGWFPIVGGPTACTGISGALPDVMFSGAYPPVSLSL